MILLPLIVLAAQKSLSQQVMSRPDPTNGYADYVRAAEQVQHTTIGFYQSWTSGQYASMLEEKKQASEWSDDDESRLTFAAQLKNLDFLEVQRREVRDFGAALELVRIGNQKRVWDPREKQDAATLFPELAQFKTLAKLYRADGYVKFAAGNSQGATSDLLEGLMFARRIGGANLIAELVSIACRSLILASFEENLDHVSESDAQRVSKFVDSALAEPDTLVLSFQKERDSLVASISDMIQQPTAFFSGADADSNDQDAAVQFVANLGTRGKEEFKAALAQDIGKYFASVLEKISAQESTWKDQTLESLLPPQPQAINSVQDAADALTRNVLPSMDQVVSAEMKSRAQLRLLGLHARIIAFRWHNGRLPDELKDAAPEKLLYDPIAKGPFQYELVEDGYKLYSRGLPDTGPIELKYRRPPNLNRPSDDGIPPR